MHVALRKIPSGMNKFQTFYISNKDKLFAYLLRKTGDSQLSADLTQESFIRYLEYYKYKGSNVALLYPIGRNLLTDQLRKQQSMTEFDEQYHYAKTNQEQEFVIREESLRVIEAIRQLSKDEADILALSVGSNLSYKEISKITNLSVNNVKVKVHRSRMKLKSILKRGSA